jgi:hypothetical protein
MSAGDMKNYIPIFILILILIMVVELLSIVLKIGEPAERLLAPVTGRDAVPINTTFANVGSGTIVGPTEYRQREEHPSIPSKVSIFIQSRYSDPRQRASVTQFALAQQAAMDGGTTSESAKAANRDLGRAVSCLRSTLGEGYADEARRVLAVILSDEKQITAYAGTASTLQDEAGPIRTDSHPCDR